MKGWVALHKIPEVSVLMARFQRWLVMKGKARRYLAAMKALLHYN
jgi:hypothetical protein